MRTPFRPISLISLVALAALLSFCFMIWWPLVIVAALAAPLFFYGTATEP